MQIISFSLWGSDSTYCKGAIENAELAQTLYPEWQLYFYADKRTVPKSIIKQLRNTDNTEVILLDSKSGNPAFWRFYPMFEASANICISRDADSRLSVREKRCVEEWLDSDKQFSIIRDHPRHYDWPMLAGLWGSRGTLSQSLHEKLKLHMLDPEFTADQKYLRDCIWPIAEHSCCIHSYQEIPWMQESRDREHFMGQGYYEDRTPRFSSEDSGIRVGAAPMTPRRFLNRLKSAFHRRISLLFLRR